MQTVMLTLKMAWRNIWRNRRRTLITMGSIVMAVVLSAVMASMQQGQYDQMIDNTVGSFTGHIQVQAPGYFDKPSLDNSLELNDSLIDATRNHPEILAVIPRIDSYALAGGYKKTKAGMVIGIDIEAEKLLSKPHEKVIQGSYFTSNYQHGVLVAEGLADFLDVEVGDSLVMLGSGYHGVSAADLIPVIGILKFGITDMNNSIMYLPLNTAQEFYGAYNRVTSLALLTRNPEKVAEIANDLESTLPTDLEVYDWMELVPELIQAIQADRGSGYIILMVLYMVVGFGILGTVLMMTAERKYEFGVMLAIGTAKMRIAGMLILEMAILIFFGTITGILASLPVIYYFHFNPMEFTGQAAEAIREYGMEPFIRFSTDPEILFIQATIVAVMAIIISIYPLLHTRKLHPVEAMRS
jgi:ABC-type lipoprotein release transport system permease subunit